jgi:hypothetical protein
VLRPAVLAGFVVAGAGLVSWKFPTPVTSRVYRPMRAWAAET